ncbi:unnamed protein product [Blumeria hordei]|uniref:Mso1 N-terminal domain-containing protein n=2 Tax=Blumeria hordei TaxID=2867405 RepID=A0A383UTC3_BLUHO|nr:MFS sugar transporter [Blumeria hordei DH14]SZF03581.1 unnamed protein product [Blumeria hordei]
MSSYWSTLVTTTTSRVNSIRQNLLAGENDGDTEDDTYLCRVLRSYYTEKGRSFPAWLPPDPRAPPPVVVQPVYSPQNVGSRYGSVGTQQTASSSFASLFGNSNETPNPPQDASSLRQGRGGQARLGATTAAGARPNAYNRGQSNLETSQVQSRPLPSKMAGSYQNADVEMRGNARAHTPPMSAKDRLRAGNLRRPEMRSQNSSFERSEKPFVAATSPWANNETEFGGGGYEPPPRIKPPGIPSNPSNGRKMGLPSGPRGKR